MRYLITSKTEPPFLTDWFDHENFFNDLIGMVVYDLYQQKYTKDGINWLDIGIDHL